ncbi:MAG: hypothetical protein V3W19_16290 [Desulfatiglandales bacterium]
MAIKKLRPWLLPLMFLLGFLCAWGMILVDRQMLMDEQEELRQEIITVRVQMKLRELTDAFDYDWQQMVIWNEEAVEVPKETGK